MGAHIQAVSPLRGREHVWRRECQRRRCGGNLWARNHNQVQGERKRKTFPPVRILECLFSDLFSYLRTMTALLDPAQLEERGRRRLKQLELQGRRHKYFQCGKIFSFSSLVLFLREPSMPRLMKRKAEKGTRRDNEEEKEVRRVFQEREMLSENY